MARTLIVIPCFDEADRLPVGRISAFLEKHADTGLILVNDGSRDQTLDLLRRIESAHPGRVSVVDQQPNRGKAEAVRAGMNVAFEQGARFAGYFDADLAAPLEEVPRLIEVLETHDRVEMVLGARVQLMGRRIERSATRHYLGRVFATVASLVLELPVYDTQCGAKLFRVSDSTKRLFAEPFVGGWIFDVEILARRIAAGRADTALPDVASAVYELPLDEWIDVAGSKVGPVDFGRAIWAILRIRNRYLTSRGRPPGGS